MFMAPLYCSGALAEGEKSFYNFMCRLYSDMYDNPEKYYIPAGEYDDFMNGRERRSLDKKYKQKESRLRNRFQQSIQFYQKLLFEIGRKAEFVSHNTFKFNKLFLGDMINIYNLRTIRGEEVKRAMALSNTGLEVEETENELIIKNDEYPEMYDALCAIANVKNNKYSLTNFLRCDFRGLTSCFKPCFDDVSCVLPENYKCMALEMDELMRGLRCKVSIEPLKNTTLYSQWKVSYKYNGKLFYSFHADTNDFEIFAHFNDYKNISCAGYFLKEHSKSIYNWFYDKVPERKCTCPNNRLADIGGIKKGYAAL